MISERLLSVTTRWSQDCTGAMPVKEDGSVVGVAFLKKKEVYMYLIACVELFLYLCIPAGCICLV